jgi:mRNA-degrading endonuclease RelE of RelBE toxin-antitoxin system
MNSHTTDAFRKAFSKLPADVRKQARQAYRLFIENPYHPSLRFKSIHPTRPIYSVRIGLNYRAVGVRDGQDVIWFWIGSHAEYDKLIQQFKK